MQTVTVSTGEKRLGRSSSTRAYFFAILPSGDEVGLAKCPSLRRLSNKAEGVFGSGDRINIAQWSVEDQTMIKMFASSSEFGKISKNVSIYIVCDETDALITVNGYVKESRFGFMGRGRVDMKRTALTEAELKKVFGYTVLERPTVTRERSVRTLIFTKTK